ncbi:Ohr family peroxiredoxin [Sphingomonas sp. S2-65]|uniref:Ohr family peroxiredoxin n=1 Tax=Sphingomonas sp. S2-65 TaxID=2903960 RepID=UPI001F30DD93|nr:Ohr family peroxiredoxin [Sphingomonas sp. S2-65]UYY58414.1 OsmC family protein [Sphingomonas sp. S2-65]
MDILYRARASATGGRTGHAMTDDGALAFALMTPKELGGPAGQGANVEQLFACGYAASFLGAVKFVARRHKLELTAETNVAATVGIGMREDGTGFGLDVALAVTLPEIEPALAADLIEEAGVVCPYSHLTRNGLAVRVFLAA